MHKAILALFLSLIFLLGSTQIRQDSLPSNSPATHSKVSEVTSPLPTPIPSPLPSGKTLPGGTHAFQTFNNCGPASMSMALSLLGRTASQQELGQILRPYQNPQGDNDDKSVTLTEMADLASRYQLLAYHRPYGNSELIKKFIAADIPVVTRTTTKVGEDIGHYRVIKGYTSTHFIQDDSLQGKNLKYTYADFDALWKSFNYEYLVFVPKDKQQLAEAILGEDVDPKVAWSKAVAGSVQQLEQDPADIFARFNLSVAYYHVDNYSQSVAEFEQVESKLPFRTLWYQIEPLRAYYELKNYDRVLSLTDKILANYNRAFAELYVLRGEIFKARGDLNRARQEFELAIRYNKNLSAAKAALGSLK